MILYLLRHAIAVERGTPGFSRDDDRPLTPKGRRKMHHIAGAMKAMGLSVDAMFSSPFLRALETAEIAAAALGMDNKVECTPLLAPDGDAAELVHFLVSRHEKTGRVMLIGHEPFLSGFVSVLVGGEDGCSITFKKGGLCKIDASPLRYGRCASLEWLMTPRQLTRME